MSPTQGADGSDAEAVRASLRQAVARLIEQDWRLLALHGDERVGPVSERAVAAALAWHVRRAFGSRWDVDCDYNRSGAGAHAAVKTMSGDSRQAQAIRAARTAGGGQSSDRVTPDLVVHMRGGLGPAKNLLAVELKTDHVRQSHVGGSLDTVVETVRAHAYRHGSLLDLRLAGGAVRPSWIWVDQYCTEAAQADVFLADELEIIIARGRRRASRRYSGG